MTAVNDPGWHDRQSILRNGHQSLGGCPFSMIAKLGVDKTHDERTITIIPPAPSGFLVYRWETNQCLGSIS